MLDNEEFDISPKCLFEFKDALRNLVDELSEKKGLNPKTLGEYLNKLGDILFLEDEDDADATEARMVRLMAVVAEYLMNEEFRYSLREEYEDDVELE